MTFATAVIKLKFITKSIGTIISHSNQTVLIIKFEAVNYTEPSLRLITSEL